MDLETVKRIKRHIVRGHSLTALAEKYHVSYAAVYKIAIGASHRNIEPTGRLIPEQTRALTDEQAAKAFRLKTRRKYSNARLAQKFGVSESVIARAVRAEHKKFVDSVREFYLASGDSAATIERFSLTTEQLEDLLASSTAPNKEA